MSRPMLALLTWIALVAALGCSPRSVGERPNIVFVISDDQSYEAIGAAGVLPWLETPNLDRLAQEGVRFANAFVTSSLCSPARASYLTGQYARSHGVLGNREPLSADTITFASLLTDAGYDSAYIGKWHMDGQGGPRPGFAYSASFVGQGQYQDCPFQLDGVDTPTRGFVDDVSTDFAIEFLRRPRDGPFLLMLGYKASHTPLEPPAHLAELYADTDMEVDHPGPLSPFPPQRELKILARQEGVSPDDYRPAANWRSQIDGLLPQKSKSERPRRQKHRDDARRRYYRLITAADENLGRLLDALDDLGHRDDTIVVFAADNGVHHLVHKVGLKRTAYDEAMRVPLILRYPRLATPARVAQELVLNVDLAPTLLDLAGLEIPESMQGRSLRPLLAASRPGFRDDFLYEYYREAGYAQPTSFAVRTNDPLKLIVYPGYPEWTELYDLRSDPHEAKNRVSDPEYAGQLAELRARLDAHVSRLGPAPEGAL